MCGIVYSMRLDGKPARKTVWKRYTKQRGRGSEGFGYVAIERGMVASYKRVQHEKEARAALEKENASTLLFHHRYPTSTINVPEAAHPIIVKHKELNGTWYVVHNGIISNPDELRASHEKLGYDYTTLIRTQYTAGGNVYHGASDYNDSEALAIELARTLEGKQRKVSARGSIAYIALETRAGKAVALYYGTNGGNPLTRNDAPERGITIASQGGKAINDNICYRLDLRTLATGVVPLELERHITYTERYDTTGYTWPIIGHGGKPIGFDAEKSYEALETQFSQTIAGQLSMSKNDLLADNERAQELRLYLDELDVDIELAKQAEEWEELQSLTIERGAIVEELREVAMSRILAG